MRITQGTFSFLPDLTDEQIAQAGRLRPAAGLGGLDRVHRRPASAQRLLGDVGPADVRPEGRRRRRSRRLRECRKAHGTTTSRSTRSTRRAASRPCACRSSCIVRSRRRATGCVARRARTARPLHARACLSRRHESTVLDLKALLAESGVGEVLDELDRELVGLAPVKTCAPRDRLAAGGGQGACGARRRGREALAAHVLHGQPGHRQDDGRDAHGDDPAPARSRA